MEKLIDLKLVQDKESVLIQSTKVEYSGGLEQTEIENQLSLQDMLQKTKPFYDLIITSFQQLSIKPKSVSAEFGLNFSREGKLFICSANSDPILKLTVNWELTNS